MTELYTPGEMSRQYQQLSRAEQAEVNRKVNDLFRRNGGTARKLDPNRRADWTQIREWLRTRDDIMAQRLGRGPAAPAPASWPPRMQPYVAEMQLAMEQDRETYWAEFEAAVARNAELFEALLGLLDEAYGRVLPAAEKARRIAQLWANMRAWGCTNYDIVRGIQVIVTNGRNEMPIVVRVVDVFSDRTSALTRIAPHLKKAGVFAEVISGLINSAIGMRRGDYHIVCVEFYKIAMGLGIPWAGLIDDLEPVLAPLLPESWTSHDAFKVLKALNPIGLGAQAVDFLWVAATLAVSGKMDDARVYRLADRMKQSPGAFFFERGEDMATALVAMAEMKDDEFRQMMSARNIWAWLNDFWLTKYTPLPVLYRLVRDLLRP